MKHITSLTLTFFSILLFSACGSQPGDDVTIIDATKHDFAKWNDIMEVVDTIPLQQTDESALSYTDDMILCNDGFLLIDVQNNKIIKFSLDGQFLYATGELGRANNEYIRPLGISLTSDGKQFVLLDETGLMYYDLETGKFIRKDKPFDKGQYWDKFIIDNSGDILYFAANLETTIGCIMPENSKINLRKFRCKQLITKKFYLYDNMVNVLPDWGKYDIEYFDNGQLKPKYHIDFGKDIIPQEWSPQTTQEFQEKDMTSNLFRSVFDACETNDYLCALVVGPEQCNYNLIYNKKTNKAYLGKAKPSYCHQFIGSDGEYVYMLVYQYLLKEDSPLYSYTKSLESIGNQNPFVVKVQIKG